MMREEWSSRERTRTRRLHVMHVTPGLRIGGLPRVVETLCRATDRSRFHVSVLCLRHGGPLADELRDGGIPVYNFEAGDGRTSYLTFRRVAKLLRRERVDVLHTHNTEPLLDGVPGALLAGVRRVIHTDHGRYFPDKLRYMLAEWILSGFVDKIVGVSEDTVASLVRYEHIPRRKLVVIPNGIDGTPYFAKVDVVAARRGLGIGTSGPVVGVAGRLTPEKGIEYLLHATVHLRQRFPNLAVLVAGDGDRADHLARLAANLGLSDTVRFLGIRRDIATILGSLDVFVLPSVREGLPMVVLEAMAAALPIVATDVGGVPMAVRHGTNGLLVEPRNPGRLADAVGGLLGDPERLARFGARGRDIFRCEFSGEVMTRRYEALYEGDRPSSRKGASEG